MVLHKQGMCKARKHRILLYLEWCTTLGWTSLTLELNLISRIVEQVHQCSPLSSFETAWLCIFCKLSANRNKFFNLLDRFYSPLMVHSRVKPVACARMVVTVTVATVWEMSWANVPEGMPIDNVISSQIQLHLQTVRTKRRKYVTFCYREHKDEENLCVFCISWNTWWQNLTRPSIMLCVRSLICTSVILLYKDIVGKLERYLIYRL